MAIIEFDGSTASGEKFYFCYWLLTWKDKKGGQTTDRFLTVEHWKYKFREEKI